MAATPSPSSTCTSAANARNNGYQTLQAEVYAVYPARRYLPMKVQVLLQCLQQQLSQPPGAF